MRRKIKVALIGVGNCASSLVQGIQYYTLNNTNVGLMHPDIGGYKVSDILVVAAFDVDKRKVGSDLARAIFAPPNCTKKIIDVPQTGIIVNKGPVMDGVAKHMEDIFLTDKSQKTSNVKRILKNSGAEMFICYLPVGSVRATRYYAQAALDTGVGFINAIPEFICSNNSWISRFQEKGLPCAGDDIKSQVGATILHRTISRLIQDRGQKIDTMYQLNIGGNTDFLNMTDKTRIVSKRKSKTQAVMSILDDKVIQVHIGPSDYVSYLKDNKICYLNIKGRQFAEMPFDLDVKLSVEDSPNSAGVMVDVIRAFKLAIDRGITGHLTEVSSYAFKSPRTQYRDEEAKNRFEKFINST
ncbi:MAG: inositol-3-phosphate synthase [bacterium]|nr:inositol-3-phosphate synthase [bacterium]